MYSPENLVASPSISFSASSSDDYVVIPNKSPSPSPADDSRPSSPPYPSSPSNSPSGAMSPSSNQRTNSFLNLVRLGLADVGDLNSAFYLPSFK